MAQRYASSTASSVPAVFNHAAPPRPANLSRTAAVPPLNRRTRVASTGFPPASVASRPRPYRGDDKIKYQVDGAPPSHTHTSWLVVILFTGRVFDGGGASPNLCSPRPCLLELHFAALLACRGAARVCACATLLITHILVLLHRAVSPPRRRHTAPPKPSSPRCRVPVKVPVKAHVNLRHARAGTDVVFAFVSLTKTTKSPVDFY